ncbi:MAG: MATE family efflux transporter [Firmicutes bacterium]|nr:MATE family efflux transporter [Bacillota bacterium]
MVRHHSRQISLTEGNIAKNMLLYFFPILFGSFFQQLYNTIDAIIVGNFVSQEALAAVGGASGNIINLLVGFFVGLAGGTSVIIAQYYGAREYDNVKLAVHTGIALAIAGGAGLMVIGLLITHQALVWMRTPEDVFPMAETYIRIYFLGTVPNVIFNIGSGILNASGDSKKPLFFLIVSCITNIILDLLFVAVFRMGVLGVALATILSQTVSAVLVLYTLSHSRDCYRLFFREIRFTGRILKQIIRIGLPSGLQSTMFAIANTLIQSTINSFGSQVMAAWTAFGKTDSIFWMILGALGITQTTFSGQNYGARKFGRMRRVVQTGALMTTVFTVFISIVIILLRRAVLGLFLSDEETIRIAITIMMAEVPYYILYVPMETFPSACRSAGDTLRPMLITASGVCVFRILWLVFIMPRWHTPTMLAYSYPASWALTSVIYFVYYYRMKWLVRYLPKDLDPKTVIAEYRSRKVS